MIYLITYDLKNPGQNYQKVAEAIKEATTVCWCKYWESSYLIQTSNNANQILKKIQPHLDSNDRLFVVRVTKEYQGWLSKEEWNYINEMFASDSSY